MAVTHTKKSGIEELESWLQASLQPVAPRPDFVQNLKRRLMDVETPVVQYPNRNSAQLILLLAASLLSSTFLLLNGSRLILAILASIGLLQQFRRQREEKQLVTPG